MDRRRFFKRFSLASIAALAAPTIAGGMIINNPPTKTAVMIQSVLSDPRINNVVLFRNYWREHYNIHHFDRLKNQARELGIIDVNTTLLCGKAQYRQIEGIMKLWVDMHTEDTVSKGQLFMKNGVTYWMYMTDDLEPWTMIIFHGERIDFNGADPHQIEFDKTFREMYKTASPEPKKLY